MSLRIRDLLDMPHLRLVLRAGATGTDREVTWAQASDLDQPWEWMTGGELLMKNGHTLPAPDTEQSILFEGLADHDISGVVLGIDPDTPQVGAATITRANDLGFPIILAPYSVGFGAIGRAVAHQTSAAEARRVVLTGRVYNAIRRSVTNPAGAEPLKALSQDLACKIAVLDAETGQPVLDNAPGVPATLHEALTDEIKRRGGALPGVVHLEVEGERAHMVEVPDEEPTVLMTYAFRAAPPDIVLLQHVAIAAAVLLSQQNIRRDHERRVGAELLAQILDHRIEEHDADRLLHERDLSPANTVLIAADGVSDSDERQVHLTLHRRAVPNLLHSRSGLLYALVPSSREVIRILHRRLGTKVAIGVSDPLLSCERAPSAMREANWAVRDATTTPGRMIRYSESSPLSVLRDTEEAQIVVDRVLGRLLEYDRKHDTDLTETLDTYLSCGRSWQQTAAVTGVHRQTVIYRMRRVEEITGRSLAGTGQLADFWIALRARDIVTAPKRR